MEDQFERIRQISSSLAGSMTALRRELHRHPELACREQETRRRMLAWLDEQGVLKKCTVREPLIGTDLVLELPGTLAGTIGLRADMDALPIKESSDLPHASQQPGMMHACGHDGHMTMLAGCAAVLVRMDMPRPTVRFIFQPGEEEVCAGADLVEAGVCRGLDEVYALHGWPGIERGMIASKPGVIMAAANSFSVTCRGVSCHGAVPEKGKNPLFPAAELITRLGELHRWIAREHGGVVSPCSVTGGESTNGIPETAVVRGTVRYLAEETGELIKQEFFKIIRELQITSGMPFDTDYRQRYRIPVINDPDSVRKVLDVAGALAGADRVRVLERHSMVAEDFSFYLKQVPGCMFLLGMGEQHPGLHSDRFDFDDSLLETGAAVFAGLATRR